MQNLMPKDKNTYKSSYILFMIKQAAEMKGFYKQSQSTLSIAHEHKHTVTLCT